MLKKISIIILIVLFIIYVLFFAFDNKEYSVDRVISPVELVLDNGDIYKITGAETFDAHFTEKKAAPDSICCLERHRESEKIPV